jgi:hypothetical protein
MSGTSFSTGIQWRCPFCDQTNLISLFYMYVYALYTIFQCEFNDGVHFVIRLTIFGNFFVLYVCICVIHHFSM